LVIHGLDLRHTPSVEAFCHLVEETEPRLDYLIHNACQTVRRPAGFYGHLMEGERTPPAALPPAAQGLVAPRVGLARRGAGHEEAVGLTRAAELSQLELLEEDRLRGGAIFPADQLDADLQQVDRRLRNSWRLTLAEVPTVELLEV